MSRKISRPVSFILAVFLTTALSLNFVACGEDEGEIPPPVPPKPAVEKKKAEPKLQPVAALAEPVAVKKKVESKQGTSGSYVLQVGVSQVRAIAEKTVRQLEKDGLKAYISKVDDPGDLIGTYYRIRLGYFPSVTEARLFGHNVLKPLNRAFWIDNRKNDDVGQPKGYSQREEEEESPDESMEQPSSDDWGSTETPEVTPEPAAPEKTEALSAEPAEPTAPVVPATGDGWGEASAAPPPEKVAEETVEKAAEVVVPTAPTAPAIPVTPAKTTTPVANDGWGDAPTPAETTTPAVPAVPASPEKPAADDGWGDAGNDWGTP